MKLEIRLHAPRFAPWLLFVVAGVCWLVGIDYRLDHHEGRGEKDPT